MITDDYLKRYYRFGWDYEFVNPISDKERQWYVDHALTTTGPVLELACGGGRLLISLAEAGLECDGLDLCDEMLEFANKKIRDASPETQKLVRLHKLDITDFELDREYGTVIIADNSLRDLKNLEQQKACVEMAYRHLRKNGLFLATLRRFEPQGLANSRRETGWSPPVTDPVSGKKYQRKVVLQISESNRKSSGFILYREVDSVDEDDVIACPFEFPLLTTAEYADLFHDAGFSVQVQAGYENKDDDGSETITNFVCCK